MPEETNPDDRSTQDRNRCLEPEPKSSPERRGLAVDHERCKEKTQVTLSDDLRELGGNEH